MSDLKIGDRVTGIKGNTRVTGTVMNIKEGHVHIKAPVSGVYAPLVSIVPLHKVTKLGEGAMKRKAEAEDDRGMSDYMHDAQTSSAPFDDAKPAKPHQDQFGNKIKIGNVAKNLAKQGMSGIKKEEVEQVDEAGVMKKVGRAIAGWGAFDKDKPKDVVKNTKSMSSTALSRIATAKKGSFSLKKSPAALQQKVAKRELEKRSVSEEVEQVDEVGPQKRLKRVFNKLRDARAGAAYKQSGMPVPERESGHKNTVDHNKALGRALRKMGEEADKSGLSPEQIARRKKMDAADFKNRRDEMNSKRQAGTAPLRTTYREEVELDEASTKPKSIWQQAAIDGRKKGTELGKKTAEEFHKNVNAKGIHRGHPEHEDLFYKHVDKFSEKTLSKNFTSKGAAAMRHQHASNAAHDAFHRHIDKLHDTAMKKDPAYKAKFDKNEADKKKRSAKAEIEYQAANAKIDKLRGEHHTGSPSHIEAINKVRKEHGHEITQSALYNHYGDGDGNLPTWAGGHGTNAERAKHHYNMYVAGTGGHGDRGYRYEEVEQVEEGYKGRRAFGSAYDKTHDPFQDSKRAFKSRELEHELAHEAPSGPAHHDQTPHDVHIDGKKWKTFGSAGHAHNVANKLSISGKRASVHKTPIAEKAPPGWEGTVKAMKKHPEIDNPYALAWWMKRKGAKSHKDEK